jgi:hypothetical protein
MSMLKEYGILIVAFLAIALLFLAGFLIWFYLKMPGLAGAH